METSLNFSSHWPDFKCASAKVEWWLHPLFLHPWQVEPGHIGHIGHIQHLAPNHRLAEVGPPPSRSSHPPEDFVDQQSCWFLYIFAASVFFADPLSFFYVSTLSFFLSNSTICNQPLQREDDPPGAGGATGSWRSNWRSVCKDVSV